MMESSGGYLDGRSMATTFNMLRANDLLWRYVVSNYLLGEDPPAFALLYWNNDGTRVPGKVHSRLLRDLFLHNKLQEPGALEVMGMGIDLGKVETPTYSVAAKGDHIVPWQGAYKICEVMGGPVRFVLTEGGHIAGVVNPPTPEKKRGYFVNEGSDAVDPENWLVGAEKVLDSWWTDWVPWLKGQSGKLVAPPQLGSEAYPPIMDAPGRYVMEK
jgi:polyhydroxyalkanoate synthase